MEPRHLPSSPVRLLYVAEEGVQTRTCLIHDARIQEKENVIILCDSWYIKNLDFIVDEFESLDLIFKTKSNSIIRSLSLVPIEKGHIHNVQPMSIYNYENFALSSEKSAVITLVAVMC